MSSELIYMQRTKPSEVKEKCYICEKELGNKQAITILTQTMHVECVVNAIKFYKEAHER